MNFSIVERNFLKKENWYQKSALFVAEDTTYFGIFIDVSFV